MPYWPEEKMEKREESRRKRELLKEAARKIAAKMHETAQKGAEKGAEVTKEAVKKTKENLAQLNKQNEDEEKKGFLNLGSGLKKKEVLQGVFEVKWDSPQGERDAIISEYPERLQTYLQQQAGNAVVTMTKQFEPTGTGQREVLVFSRPGDTVTDGVRIGVARKMYIDDVRGSPLERLFKGNKDKSYYIFTR